MKQLTIITALLMTFATQAVAVSGSMTCKVKTSYIVAIEEGITETFKGYANGAKVGDTVTFAYEATNRTLDAIFEAGFKGANEKELSMFPIWKKIRSRDFDFEVSSGTIGTYVKHLSGAGLIEASQDYFNFNTERTNAKFERYYK